MRLRVAANCYIRPAHAVRRQLRERAPHAAASASRPRSRSSAASCVHPRKFNEVAEFLVADDFYHPALRAIYEAMIELDAHVQAHRRAHRRRADARRSRRFDKLRAFNGADYLDRADVARSSPSRTSATTRASCAARRRRGASSRPCREISARGYGEYGDVDEYIDAAEREIFEIAQRSQKQSFEHDQARSSSTTIEALEKRYERKQAITGVPTGYHKLDAMTAGLQPGDLIIIAARPSMGKTSFVMNVVQNAAMRSRACRRWCSRWKCRRSRCASASCAREARVDSTQAARRLPRDRATGSTSPRPPASIAEAPIFIDDSGSPTLLEIRAKARRWRSDTNIFKATPSSIGIDRHRLPAARCRGAPTQGRQPRSARSAEISRGLKALAKELRVPGDRALAAQPRRSSRAPTSGRMLSDLRESGAIEQDADVIAFIYRDEVYSKDECKKRTRAWPRSSSASSATARPARARLAFLNTYTRFENLADTRE